jgi:hypothetical protein
MTRKGRGRVPSHDRSNLTVSGFPLSDASPPMTFFPPYYVGREIDRLSEA